ncbi:MAG TPA: polysaccharide deacetylase family protein [Kofleriaceae bacterium]|nr:polysaccharide deacetylase family protein [Kofleriaceae bacterium]
MIGKRERVARLLDRARIFDAILDLRARVRAPVLSALCYHSVGEPGGDYLFDDDVIDATPQEMRAQMAILARHCTVLGREQVTAIMDGARVPPNPVIITFDDGYRSCRDVALPILAEFGFTATFFIATDYVSQRRPFWWDSVNYLVKRSAQRHIEIDYPHVLKINLGQRLAAIEALKYAASATYDLDMGRFLDGLARAARVTWSHAVEEELAAELIMTWQDVCALRSAGMDIASHTRSHQVLRNLSVAALEGELAGSRSDIEREVGESTRSLAYPVGYRIGHIPKLRAAVQRAGYDIGFTNASGVNYLWRGVDRYGVRRLATGRGMSDAMFRGQLAVPPLAYTRST